MQNFCEFFREGESLSDPASPNNIAMRGGEEGPKKYFLP